MVRSNTFQTLMRRLSQSGFKRDFIRSAILPDWWDEACASDPNALSDVEIRVARFLQRSIADIKNPTIELSVPQYAQAKLRRVRNIDRDRLRPAIHSALQIAGAVLRSLRANGQPSDIPTDAPTWRHQISPTDQAINLNDLLGDLWSRNIPVVPVAVLPAPTFQGLSCIVDGRPVILLGHKIDQPGRVAFVIAHEAGHIAARDCTPGQPVVDEEDEIADDSEIERNADLFAMRLLVGHDTIPDVMGNDFRELAQNAADMEHTMGAEASIIISAWARRTGEYAMAARAATALYKGAGARNALLEHFERNVNIDSATETDRSLLSCIYGNSETRVTAD